MHTPNVDASLEARRVAIAAVTALVVSVAFLSGFRTPAAVFAAFGFTAVLERSARCGSIARYGPWVRRSLVG